MEWVAIGTTSGDVIIWDMLQAEAVVTMVIKPASRFHLLIYSCSLPVTLLSVCVVMETVFTQVIQEVK